MSFNLHFAFIYFTILCTLFSLNSLVLSTMYMHIYKHIYIYIYIYIYNYICLYICIYIVDKTREFSENKVHNIVKYIYIILASCQGKKHLQNSLFVLPLSQQYCTIICH